jgi:hypothetical protein
MSNVPPPAMLATRDSHRPPALETYHPNIHDRPRKHAKDEENDPYKGGGNTTPPTLHTHRDFSFKNFTKRLHCISYHNKQENEFRTRRTRFEGKFQIPVRFEDMPLSSVYLYSDYVLRLP